MTIMYFPDKGKGVTVLEQGVDRRCWNHNHNCGIDGRCGADLFPLEITRMFAALMKTKIG